MEPGRSLKGIWGTALPNGMPGSAIHTLMTTLILNTKRLVFTDWLIYQINLQLSNRGKRNSGFKGTCPCKLPQLDLMALSLNLISLDLHQNLFHFHPVPVLTTTSEAATWMALGERLTLELFPHHTAG